MTNEVDGLTSLTLGVAIIVLGSLIFIISFFGCCGAAKENRCMIMTV